MSLRQAAQQALEALEKGVCVDPEESHHAIYTLRQALAEPEQEPVGQLQEEAYGRGQVMWFKKPADQSMLYTAPTPRKPLTPREVELLDGMIEVQLHHAAQCDRIANLTMAEKQKAWDMERVELLRKLKAAHGIGEQT